MDNRAIGVYDSGIGGTTVFRDLVDLLPEEEYIYFGDTKNLPYGTKTKTELLKISGAIFDFFEKKNVKAVVMACNTTSSTVYDDMKKKYKYEIYPIIQTASKQIAKKCSGNIGVLATQATINSGKYKEELLKSNPNLKVFQSVGEDWVRIVESGVYETEENMTLIRSSINPLVEAGCENIILGCTHYPYLVPVLKKITGDKINYINPSEDFTKFITEDLTQKGLASEGKNKSRKFYVSSNPENFMISSKSFYELKEMPILVENH